MAINKVEFGDQTLMDLTGDTVTPEDVLNGATFHDRAGVSRSGTASYPVTDVQVNNTSVLDGTVAKVTVPTSTSDLNNDSNFVADASYVHTDNNYTTTEKNKLSGIASGAEVNVQSDWDQTDSTKDDYIKNKPSIPSAQVNSDWNASSGVAQILNKPTLGTAAAKNYTTSVTSGSSDLVTSGAVYTAIDNLPEPMVFKGSLGTGGTITALPVDGTATIGDTYKVITAGTYAGKAAKIGDTFICLTKTSSANTWELIPSGDEPSGTVTSVATGVGLTGGTITTSGTIKAKLRSETALTNDSAAATETANRIYPVVPDKSGYLAVNVPWTDNNTDTKVTQTADDSTNSDFEVIFSNTADNTTRTEAAKKSSKLKFNPSTGNLQATQLNGVTIGSSPKFTDNNTTYTFATGDSNGQIKVTPSGGTAQNVSVKGLGSAAYTASSAYAVSATLASDANLNSITTPGLYNAGGSNSITNKPSNVDAFGLEVIHVASGGWYVQMLYPNGSDAVYRRYYNASTWSSWTQDKYTDTTYSVVSTSANGLAPKVTDTSKFLKGDGTWATPTNTTYSFANGTNGFTVTPSGGSAQTVTVTPNDSTKLPLAGGTLTGRTKFNNVSMPVSAGKITSMTAGTTEIFKDGIAISNPTTANDVGWVRVLGTGEADTVLEIATGDDGGSSTSAESIVARQYNTSSVITHEAKILDASGNTSFPKKLSAKIFQELITGSGTAAQDKGEGVSPRYFPAKWTFNTGLTPANGDTITIKIPVAGHDYGVFLSINNGTNYYPVARNNTTRLTTHYANGCIIQLVFESAGSVNDVFPLAGGDARTNVSGGRWTVTNFYDSGNTNNAVTQTATTTNADYEVLFSVTADNTTRTEGARKNSNLKFNPSTGTLTATKFSGALSGNADTASKLGTSNVGSDRQPIYLNAGAATAGNYTVAHRGNAGKSNMNDVARLYPSVGMTNLSDPGNDHDNPMNGTTRSTGWHLYFDTSYSDDPNGSNAWVAQICNKAGSSQWWVRSRGGGTITNGTAWASPWRHLVTSDQAGKGGTTTPIYIDNTGAAQNCSYTIAKSVPADAVFTDHTYTAATAAPGKVASASAQGSSANYARQDHTHGIDLATGDSNGQVKIAGTNVSVKGLGSAAYKNESGTWAINVSGSSASCTGNAATATKLATARSIALGNDFQGSANFDGSGNITISGQNYNAACNSGNKANYPWHRIATVNIGTGTYNDKNAILCIQSTYDGGRFGIVKISTRTNASGGACSCSARWLVRQVFAVDDLYIALWGTTGQDVYADVFLKCGAYARTVVYQMFGNRQFTLVASNEVNNTTASDKLTSVEVYKDIATAATEIHSKAYTSTVASVDTGNVSYANNSGTVNGKTVAVNVPADAKFTDNDTKNTAGSTDTSSKIFLIGATSQAANPQTYSHDTAYVGTDGCLYSGGTKVLTAHQNISGKLDKSGGTMTGQLKTSFNSSVAMGSYGAAATTIPNLCTELRYSSGCCGSFNLGTAYTLNNVTLAKGWYNFLWIPHRSGGNSGAADGDNCNYGCMYITGMTVAGSYVLRYSNSAIADLYNLHPDRVIYSGSVSAAVNATTCTINDGAITTSSTIEPFSSNSSGNVIAITKIAVSAGKVVLTFPKLTEATSFKVRITN